LAPLASIAHKTVACLGNHDYEALPQTEEALSALKIPLLVDDELVLETKIGKVQIIGADFHFRNPKLRLQELCIKKPRKPDCDAAILLLHNPFHFKYIPNGYADIILSGHLHGGQIGFLTAGLEVTFFSLLRLFGAVVPEQGYWGLGTNRIYAHRGTGYNGFPLRLGVPNEESLLELIFEPNPATSAVI